MIRHKQFLLLCFEDKCIQNNIARQNLINYLGIDIAKPFFDVAIPDGQEYPYYRLDNNQVGFSALLQVIPNESVVVREASGPII